MKVYRMRSWVPKNKDFGHVRRAPREERTVDGHAFASKAEAVRYTKLKTLMLAKVISWFALQPVFLLAGVRYTADFVVCWADGRVTVEEVKSQRARQRPDWRRFARNRTQVATLYNGLEVQVVEV